MSYTHIYELPKIRYTQTKDSDIIPIENENDTWHIPLGDLKMLFSNDEKINAIYQDLLSRINNLESHMTEQFEAIQQILENHESQITNLTEDVANLNVRMTTAENNTSSLTKRVTSLEERVTTVETDITAINKTLDAHNDRITQLESTVSQITVDIDSIKEQLQQHTDAISQIQQDIIDINKKIEEINAVTGDNLEELEKILREEIISKYEELLSIIDECHHQTPIIC